MINLNLALNTGVDIPVPEQQLTIHQPSISEISRIGEQAYFVGAQCLCVNKTMYIKDESLLNTTNNFQIFMTIMADKQSASKKKDTLSTLTLLFPSYNIMFTPRALVLSQGQENIMVDENNFEFLQSIFQQIFCLDGSGQESFNPGNEAARRIAEKLMRARQRVAAQQESESKNDSTFGRLISILSVGLNMSKRDLAEHTPFQIYDLIERYTLFVNWDLDIRSRLAGGKPDSQVDNWMKPIH